MKLIRLPKSKNHIMTPWLTPEEAALYCCMSRETFHKLRQLLPCPHAGTGEPKTTKYHAAILDEWLNALASKNISPKGDDNADNNPESA